MTAVPVTLLNAPPTEVEAAPGLPQLGAEPIGPTEIELIPDTDTLITACGCSASSDNPYQ